MKNYEKRNQTFTINGTCITNIELTEDGQPLPAGVSPLEYYGRVNVAQIINYRSDHLKLALKATIDLLSMLPADIILDDDNDNALTVAELIEDYEHMIQQLPDDGVPLKIKF